MPLLPVAAVLAAFAMTSPATPPVPAHAPWIAEPRRPDYSQARFYDTVASLPKAQPPLLFVGDSITEFWLTFGAPVWQRDYVPRHAANLGFSGDRTENTLWRIDRGELDGIAPGVTVLMIGTNDIDIATPPEIARGVVAVIRAIRQKLPETTIVVLGILPRDATPTAPRRVRARAVNAILAAADLGPQVRYDDVGAGLLAANGTLLPGAYVDRALHPSEEGYEKIAAALDRILDALPPKN